MILQIRLNLDIFTVWKKLKNSVVKCEKTFSLVERLKATEDLNFIDKKDTKNVYIRVL